MIHESLKKAIPDALRAKDEVKLRTLRSLVTAMTNEVVAKKRKPDEYLNDDEAMAVLKRAANQRKDSIEQFEKASRNDLAEPEKAELAFIETLMPALMSREEIEKIAKAKIAEMAITAEASPSDSVALGGGSPGAANLAALRGKFTGMLMKELKGKADGALVKAVVDNLLI
ncbi:MAG: GatB/YqeY domain-containing protein [bacterium]|nr:GatB/YqeY domain-containing protein [bacterium]